MVTEYKILYCFLAFCLAFPQMTYAQQSSCNSFNMSDIVLGESYTGNVECPVSGVCLAAPVKNGLSYVIQTVGTERHVYLVIAKNSKVRTFDDFNHYVKIAQSKFGKNYVEGSYKKMIRAPKPVNGTNIVDLSITRSVCWGECLQTRHFNYSKLSGNRHLAENGSFFEPKNGFSITYDEAKNEGFTIKMKCDDISRKYLERKETERRKSIKNSGF